MYLGGTASGTSGALSKDEDCPGVEEEEGERVLILLFCSSQRESQK